MSLWKLLRESIVEWRRDKAGQLSAATAYYTVFSIAPLLIIVMSLVGLLLEQAEVETYVLRELNALIGNDGMGAVASMLDAARRSPHTPLASAFGFVILLLGASGLMEALQGAFNSIWKVETHPDTNTIVVMLLKRVFSVGMILTLGFLLLVSLVLSAAVSITVEYVSNQLPSVAILLPLSNVILSFLAITLLFCVFFKFLPDIKIPWKTVLPGAALTALLFTLGKVLIGTLLAQWNFASAYGVAGSIIVLLLWINYSSQAMYLGAEFTKVYARDTGALVVPRSYARFKTAEDVARARRAILWGAASGVAFLGSKLRFSWTLWKRVRRLKRWFKR